MGFDLSRDLTAAAIWPGAAAIQIIYYRDIDEFGALDESVEVSTGTLSVNPQNQVDTSRFFPGPAPFYPPNGGWWLAVIEMLAPAWNIHQLERMPASTIIGDGSAIIIPPVLVTAERTHYAASSVSGTDPRPGSSFDWIDGEGHAHVAVSFNTNESGVLWQDQEYWTETETSVTLRQAVFGLFLDDDGEIVPRYVGYSGTFTYNLSDPPEYEVADIDVYCKQIKKAADAGAIAFFNFIVPGNLAVEPDTFSEEETAIALMAALVEDQTTPTFVGTNATAGPTFGDDIYTWVGTASRWDARWNPETMNNMNIGWTGNVELDARLRAGDGNYVPAMD